MKGLCAACQRPVEVVDFRLHEGVVVVRCPSCAKEQRLSLSEAPTAEPPAFAQAPAAPPPPRAEVSGRAAAGMELAVEAPAGFCPKCIAPRAPGAGSCPSCGLTFANPLATDVQGSPGLLSGFRALGAQWGDAAAHGRFLQLAAASTELAAAARLYRIRLAQRPDDAQARGSLEAAVKMASAPVSIEAIRQAPQAEEKRRTKLFVMAAILLLGPTLLFALLRLLGRN